MKLQLIYSCYLLKHGDEYLLWDTGHAMTTPNVAPKVSEVIRRPQREGWVLTGTRGDHRIFAHPNKPGTVPVAGKPSVQLPEGT